jgi:subtilase family serine protease
MQRGRGWWAVAIAAATITTTSLFVTAASAVEPPASATDATASIPTIPCPGPTPTGLVPSQVGARYDLTPLWEAGHTGQGVQVALIELGTAVDQSYLTAYQQCLGQQPVPFFSHVVPHQDPAPTPPPPSGESMSDAEMIVGLAPRLDRVDEFYSADATALEATLRAALDPANNGGRRPDLVSISFNQCESGFTEQQRVQIDELLRDAADAGVWVLKGAGDSGSSACAPHGFNEEGTACAAQSPQPLAVDFPSSSPWVIALGGIKVPEGVDPVAPAGSDEAWTQDCGGTGGGLSQYFRAPPWQATLPPGVPGDAMRMVPDIAALAGNPGYWLFVPTGPPDQPTWNWQPINGDSMTGPFHAAAFAAVISALRARHVEPPTFLTPVLYELARDPATYGSLFQDVTQGNNKVFNDECCDASAGYDLTTGLGQLDFAKLVDALVAWRQSRPEPDHPDESHPPPTTTAPSTTAVPPSATAVPSTTVPGPALAASDRAGRPRVVPRFTG